MTPDPHSEIIRRLRCAAGHLNAVVEMTESGKPSEQMLHQLDAVQGALRAAMNRMIASEVQASEAIILNSPSSKERVVELKRLQSLYTNFVHRFHHQNEVSHDRNTF
ncbi:MAG: metal-sensing transcriptional repressor [Chloroflexi bacterium]|nr:metal-sensing transcriptional repressor [Chloroflexota bacterium]MBI5704487.1 metal-sensing transcriptional repressor [Chloroflexota bacterium]